MSNIGRRELLGALGFAALSRTSKNKETGQEQAGPSNQLGEIKAASNFLKRGLETKIQEVDGRLSELEKSLDDLLRRGKILEAMDANQISKEKELVDDFASDIRKCMRDEFEMSIHFNACSKALEVIPRNITTEISKVLTNTSLSKTDQALLREIQIEAGPKIIDHKKRIKDLKDRIEHLGENLRA